MFDVMLEMMIYIYMYCCKYYLFYYHSFYIVLFSFIGKLCILNQLEKCLFLFFILWQWGVWVNFSFTE